MLQIHCMVKDSQTWINDELIEDVWGAKLDAVGAFSFCTLRRASCSPWPASRINLINWRGVLERRCEVHSCESENWSGLWHLGTCSVELQKRKYILCLQHQDAHTHTQSTWRFVILAWSKSTGGQKKWDANFWASCRGLGIKLDLMMNEWNTFASRGISESPCNLELLFKLWMPKMSFLTCHFWCSMGCSPFAVLTPAMWKEAPLPLKLLPALRFSVVLRLLAYMLSITEHSSKGKIVIPIAAAKWGN